MCWLQAQKMQLWLVTMTAAVIHKSTAAYVCRVSHSHQIASSLRTRRRMGWSASGYVQAAAAMQHFQWHIKRSARAPTNIAASCALLLVQRFLCQPGLRAARQYACNTLFDKPPTHATGFSFSVQRAWTCRQTATAAGPASKPAKAGRCAKRVPAWSQPANP